MSCVFPCKLNFYDILDVRNVESELVSDSALVLLDFDPIETMTGIIFKFVLDEMVSEWEVSMLLLTIFSTV